MYLSVVREAGRDDLPAILRLYRQLQPDEANPGPDLAQETFGRILTAEGLTIFVLEFGGEVAATTYLNVVPNLTHGASPYGIVQNVVVDEKHRGTGLGKKIMAATIEAAWNAGCYKVELTTGSTRESTHAFYRACGLSADSKTAFIVRRPTL